MYDVYVLYIYTHIVLFLDDLYIYISFVKGVIFSHMYNQLQPYVWQHALYREPLFRHVLRCPKRGG